MSFSQSPSSSPQTQTNPLIPANCSPQLAKRMQESVCYSCGQRGHWAPYCPSKSTQNTKPFWPRKDSTASSSTNKIQCPCGHGCCDIKTRYDRDFYACPIKRGMPCKDVVKWCDEAVDERDFQLPPFKYPLCQCGAGVCRRVKGRDSKYYFTCTIKQGHGSCGYCVSEDEIKFIDRKGTQRTRDDEIDNELGDELGMGLHIQMKRMRITDSPEDLSPVDVSETQDNEDEGAALNAAFSKCDDGFPDLVPDDDGNIEFTNSVSWETVEAETFLLLSPLSTSSRIRWRQIMFQSRIFSVVSFGSCPMGWLGRLLFVYPAQSLKFRTPKPFFCCVFPSYNPIIVPKQTSIHDGPVECNQLAISSVTKHTKHSTGSHTEFSGDVVSPRKSQDGERKSMFSKAERHREVVLFTQRRLLSDLETLAPHEHEFMREAAKDTFELLNVIGVDHKHFSDHVFDYINFVSSIAEIDKSMENSLTMEERIKLFEEEEIRFAQLKDLYVKTEALLEEKKRQRQLLSEQVSNLKAMLIEKQNQLKYCELETLKIETDLGDLKRNILETDIMLKERTEQTQVPRKQSDEKQAKLIAAKEVLEKAKRELEN